jgi:cysteine desulfurase / selenocysteine lyase
VRWRKPEGSGHETFGPKRVGILYGKEAWLERIPPYQGGGDMIKVGYGYE